MRSTLVTAATFIALVSSAHAETRNLSNFTGVSAADRIRVDVTVGEGYRVDVSGSDAERVSTRIDNDGTLVIRRANRPIWGGTPPIDAAVRITMPAVDSLTSSRGAELNVANVSAELDVARGLHGRRTPRRRRLRQSRRRSFNGRHNSRGGS